MGFGGGASSGGGAEAVAWGSSTLPLSSLLRRSCLGKGEAMVPLEDRLKGVVPEPRGDGDVALLMLRGDVCALAVLF